MPNSKTAAYSSATQWLYDRINYEKLARPGTHYRFTLDRMRDLVGRLGHGRYLAVADPDPPADSAKTSTSLGSERPAARILHIAGTKGKGSVATMSATMLTAAGYRVGLYTSPHLVHLEERFRVDGAIASEQQMVALIDSMRPIVQAMSEAEIGAPSFFELTTAIAIEHFHRNACDFWVLETGLGGRLDSTNVFQSETTVITSIGLDHQHVLGDTVELIAKEKAGIFKPGVPAISGVVQPSARDVIRQSAAERDAPLIELDRDFFLDSVNDNSAGGWGSRFELRLHADAAAVPVALALEGRHQINNAALAIAALDRLGIDVSDTSLAALSRLQIDARLERFHLPGGSTVILDAAHNPDSIAALVQTLKTRFAGRKIVGVFGTSLDKDAAVMLASLHDCLDHIVLTRYHGNPRYVPLDTLAELAQQTAASTRSTTWFSQNEYPIAACQAALSQAGDNAVVVICGSFFLAAEVRPWITKINVDLPERTPASHPGV